MKKALMILTSLCLICIMLIGCGKTDATISTSKELNKNLNLLSNTVRRLDTVDNEYLVNNELYTIEEIKAVPTPNTAEKIALTSSLNVILTDDITAEQVSLREDLTNALKNELVNRLYCDSNGNCKICNNKFICDDNGTCKSCNKTIICDENGNCTTCGKELKIVDNNCSSCQSSCVTTTPCNKSQNTLDCLKRISADNEKLDVEFLSLNTDSDNDNDLVLEENLIINDENTDNEDIDNNQEFNDNNQEFNDNNLDDNDSILTTNDNNYISNTNTNYAVNDIDDEIDTNKNDTLEKKNETIDTNVDNEDIDNNEVNSDLETNENDNTDSNLTTDENLTDNNANGYKFIYYSEERFDPTILKYKPRFITNINFENANTSLARYIEKLQKLYTMTADVVEANNVLADYKVLILDDIKEAKELNNCILNGTCTPTNEQVLALNNYITDIKTTINNLRKCNGHLTSEINKIATGNTGFSHSIDVTNSNYLRILNQIDTRISYHENAIATLEQIKYILEDATNNNSSSDVTIEDLNKNNEENNDIVSNTNTNENDSPIKDFSGIIVIQDGTDSDNNTIITNEVPSTNDSTITTDDYKEQDITLDNNDNITDDNDENDIFIETNNTDADVTDDTFDTDDTNETNTVDTDDTDVDLQADNNSISNIDTYMENTFSNLDLNNDKNDTYDNDTVEDDNDIDLNSEDNENITTVEDRNENNTVDNTTDNNDTNEVNNENTQNINNNQDNLNNIDNNEVANNSNTPQMVDGDNTTINNGAILDNATNTEFGVSNGLTNNDGRNTIISQNNINGNGINNDFYKYDDNGHLYNVTNGYDSDGLQNVNNKNNNVNTYKYNTLVDSINRGTINNGINNL